MIRYTLFSIPFLLLIVSCTSSINKKEEQVEPDYDHMVQADEEEWSIGDRKLIVQDQPDPQEQIILEPPLNTK